MQQRLLELVRSVALIGARRPFVALAIGLALTAAAAALLPGLRISTSRKDLVSAEHPSQKRSIEFDEKFGYTNAPAIVVSGEDPEARRKVVDALQTELAREPALDGRVLGRVKPTDLAEILLVSDPESVAKSLPPGGGAAQLDGGLASWVEILDGQLQKGLEGNGGSPEQAQSGLERLSVLFRAMDDELAEKDGLARLARSSTVDSGRTEQLAGRGLDEFGYLAGGTDHHVVALFPALDGDEGYQVHPVVESFRAARDRALASAETKGVTADVTGLPALVSDELDTIQRDLAVTSIASSLALVLTLFWAFRSFRQAMVSFLPLGFGTIVTFGIVRLVLGKLNLVTASFTSVLLGLGDFGVHIQTRYSELLRQGLDWREAMQTAMIKAGPGLLVGTITTAVAFLTTVATDFTAFAELGFITSVGLVVMLAGTYLLVPSAVLILLGKKPKPSPELPGFRALGGFVARHAKPIVVVTIALTAVAATFIPRVKFNPRYFDFLPENMESARGLRELERDAVASPFVLNLRASSVEEARTLTTRIRALETVASVESPSDMLPELTPAKLEALETVVRALEHDGKPGDFEAIAKGNVDRPALLKNLDHLRDTLDEVSFALTQAGRDPKAADDAKVALGELVTRIKTTNPCRLDALQSTLFDALSRAQRTARAVLARKAYAPDNLPPLFRHRFVSRDGSELALFVHPKGDIWKLSVLEAFNADIATVTTETAGIVSTLSEHSNMIIRGFEKASTLSALLVVVILAVGFRRASDVAIAAIPLVLGAIWMLGAMPPLGLSFNHANLVVLPLLLGLGVEAGGHIVSRYRESAEEQGGVASLADILGSTGGAVFVASLTTVWGFSVMMLGQYRAMFGMGLIMTIGMSATLAFSLLTLPAVLVLLKRAK